jgi:hypothetical protein
MMQDELVARGGHQVTQKGLYAQRRQSQRINIMHVSCKGGRPLEFHTKRSSSTTPDMSEPLRVFSFNRSGD